MSKKVIWSHTIVHNEENFIWFSLMSVVDFVDKMIVWDTGSTDKTVKIIEEVKKIKGDKIEFRQVGEADKYQFSKLRQKMLEESKCDWILILDGDEVWWEDSLISIRETIERNSNIEGIVTPMIVPVGDLFHIQEEKAGMYQILGKKGHLSLKLINKKIPGLHVDLPYGKEGYFDADNKPVQERKKIMFLETPLLHLTHLKRSSQKRKDNKVKHELGERVPAEYKYPEVLYKEYPSFITSPWVKMSIMEYSIAGLLNPLRKIKRTLNE